MVIFGFMTKVTGWFPWSPLMNKTSLYCIGEIRRAALAIPPLHSASRVHY